MEGKFDFSLYRFFLHGPGLEPTTYRTWGEQPNHYITDAAKSGNKKSTVKARQYNDQKGFRVMLFKPIFNNISVIGSI
jgi:hypothetical protein